MAITVRDNGKGFAKGQDAYAAKRFSQPGVVSGAGIGLAAARLLAERTGGSLKVANPEKGGGAQVTLRLPLVTVA
jgi:signal transduction histidine kinase